MTKSKQKNYRIDIIVTDESTSTSQKISYNAFTCKLTPSIPDDDINMIINTVVKNKMQDYTQVVIKDIYNDVYKLIKQIKSY